MSDIFKDMQAKVGCDVRHRVILIIFHREIPTNNHRIKKTKRPLQQVKIVLN